MPTISISSLMLSIFLNEGCWSGWLLGTCMKLCGGQSYNKGRMCVALQVEGMGNLLSISNFSFSREI
uniref:Putative secreted protein n=1 Tax=Anopheles triannulatus TaxID=58253 RepID=A0A2M4B0S8_9DIPT